ncbi:MAG: aminopeptidase P family protein [Boseongicola sp.]
MFQSFESTTSPDQGPPRLDAIREVMRGAGVDCFLVPRADAHQGEYVAPCDERLAWLTGFTGSAGFAAITQSIAGVFVDGRYRIQVRDQVARVFTPINWPETQLGNWISDVLAEGSTVGFDPWLHTADELRKLRKALESKSIEIKPIANLVDAIWDDRPPRPAEPVFAIEQAVAGVGDEKKRKQIAKMISDAGQRSAVITLPDSICWLLNIRGGDIPRNPIVHAFAIVFDDARVLLFSDPSKFDGLGPDPDIGLKYWSDFDAALKALEGPVRVDRSTAPIAISDILKSADIEVVWGDDPCILPKACKNEAEIAATREAHLRDGAAMVEFLAWFDGTAPSGNLSEIDAAKALEGYRRATNALHDISFDTISAAGPNAAIPHYRVTEDSNRPIRDGEIYLVDSGGQYVDGTTDITRTVIVGTPSTEQIKNFTRVLQGMIAISQVRFPRGLAGRDLDPLARAPLWIAGQDFDHGTGHGVGVFMCVHEGPQRLSRISEVKLEPGMILSNEPGYYREGEYGIRIENLIVVREAEKIGDNRDQLDFETITYAPIDLRLVDTDMMSPGERAWLNDYHEQVCEKLSPRVSEEAREWLAEATRSV